MKRAFRKAVEARELAPPMLAHADICDESMAAAVARIDDVMTRARNLRIALITGERDVSLLLLDLIGASSSAASRVSNYETHVSRLLTNATKSGCHDLWDSIADELCTFDGDGEGESCC